MVKSLPIEFWFGLWLALINEWGRCEPVPVNMEALRGPLTALCWVELYLLCKGEHGTENTIWRDCRETRWSGRCLSYMRKAQLGQEFLMSKLSLDFFACLGNVSEPFWMSSRVDAPHNILHHTGQWKYPTEFIYLFEGRKLCNHLIYRKYAIDTFDIQKISNKENQKA